MNGDNKRSAASKQAIGSNTSNLVSGGRSFGKVREDCELGGIGVVGFDFGFGGVDFEDCKVNDGLPTDRVALDEYMGVWFCSKVSEAVEVRSMGISFRTELQEKITSRRHVIEHLEKVGATSGWLMRLNRDQEDDVSLLGLLDTFVHRMYEIVRKREKDVRELDY
ncbi:hypothetical protein Tco_0720952 [Tanacetum coccineum]